MSCLLFWQSCCLEANSLYLYQSCSRFLGMAGAYQCWHPAFIVFSCKPVWKVRSCFTCTLWQLLFRKYGTLWSIWTLALFPNIIFILLDYFMEIFAYSYSHLSIGRIFYLWSLSVNKSGSFISKVAGLFFILCLWVQIAQEVLAPAFSLASLTFKCRSFLPSESNFLRGTGYSFFSLKHFEAAASQYVCANIKERVASTLN